MVGIVCLLYVVGFAVLVIPNECAGDHAVGYESIGNLKNKRAGTA